MDSRSHLLVGLALAAATSATAQAQARLDTVHVAPVGNLDTQLCRHVADGRTLAVATRGENALLETWELGTAGWQHRLPAASPEARTAYALGYDPGRRAVVLFGGISNVTSLYLGDTWEWDSVTWSLRTPVTAPTPRAAAAAAHDRNRGRFVLYGGTGDLGLLDEEWGWNGSAWVQLTSTATRPGLRAGGLMDFDDVRGRLVLFGGVGPTLPLLDDTWEHDGTTWIPVATAVHPPGLRSARMVFDPVHARCVLYGGRGLGAGTDNLDVWEWNGSQWSAHAAAVTPGARLNPGLAFDDARQRIVLHGGDYLTDTWELDPVARTWSRQPYAVPRWPTLGVAAGDFAGGALYHTPLETLRWDFAAQTWQELPSPTRPTATPFAMSFDMARREAVLFTSSAETWTWDQTTSLWQQRTPTNSPPPTMFAAMAYDLGRGRTVLFGGYVNSSLSGQVWEWDGLDWAPVPAPSGPSPRYGAGAAYDYAAGTVVVFGGITSATAAVYANDVWDWDGTTWTQRVIGGPSPSPRGYPGATSTVFGVVIVGGQDQTVLSPNMMSDEIWLLQGTQWVQQPSAVAWRSPAVAADLASSEVVMFNGVPSGSLQGMPEGVWTLGRLRPRVETIGGPCPGSGGVPVLQTAGEPAAGNATFALRASALPSSTLSAFAFGLQPRRFDLPTGCRLFVDPIAVATIAVGASGAVAVAMPIPGGTGLLGVEVHAQCIALDPVGNGLSATPALRLRIGS